MILRSDTSTGQQGRKTFVLLGCERGGQLHFLAIASLNYVSIIYVCSFHCKFLFLAIVIANWQS